jgi:hypothetical protein
MQGVNDLTEIKSLQVLEGFRRVVSCPLEKSDLESVPRSHYEGKAVVLGYGEPS